MFVLITSLFAVTATVELPQEEVALQEAQQQFLASKEEERELEEIVFDEDFAEFDFEEEE